MEHYGDATKYAEVAMNSAGSASEKYQSAYMGGIEAAQAKFQATFDQLSTTIWDSDVIKGTFDAGSGLLGFLTAIIGLTNPLTALGGVIAGLAGAKGSGLIDFRADGQGLLSRKYSLGKIGLGEKFQGKVDSDAILRYNDAIQKGLQVQTAWHDATVKSNGEIVRLNGATKSLIQSAKGGAVGVEALAAATEKSAKSFSLASLGIKALSVAGNMLAGMAISWALQGIATVIDNIVNADQKAIEKSNELVEAYQERQQVLQNNKSTVAGLTDEYGKLAKGVDSFGNNVSLSNDEYSRYNEIANQIASMFPSMILGYTEQGNAILKNKGDIEALNNALLENQRIANNKTVAEAPEIRAGVQAALQQNSSSPDVEKAGKKFLEEFQNGISGDKDKFQSFWQDFTGAVGSFDESYTGQGFIEKYGFSANKLSAFLETTNLDLKEWYQSWGDTSIFDKLLDPATAQEKVGAIQSALGNVTSAIDAELLKTKSGSDALLSTIIDTDTSLDSDAKAMIRAMANSISSETYKEFANMSNSDITSYLRNNIIRKFTREDGVANVSAFKKALDTKDAFAQNEISIEEYKSQINSLFDLISEWEPESRSLAEKMFGDDSDIDQKIESIKQKGGTKFEEFLGGLNKQEIDIAYSIDPTGMSVEDFNNAIKLGKQELGGVSDLKFTQISAGFEAVTTEASLLNQALQEQSTAQGISMETYEELISLNKDYASAIEYSSGAMKLNSQLSKQIANQNIATQIGRATAQLKLESQQYRRNQDALSNYYKQWKNGDASVKSSIADKINALKNEQSAIEANITKYNVLISNLRQATDAYSVWQQAQSTPEAGDMYTDLISASKQIESGLQSGRTGSLKFEASVDLLIPDSIDPEDNAAIANYKRDFIDRYLTFDSETGAKTAWGLENFTQDLMNLENPLLKVLDDGTYELVAGTKLQDICDALQITPEMARSIFGELEEFDWKIDWSDELNSELQLTEEEVSKYTDTINKAIDGLGSDAVTLAVNSEELKQCEAELFDLKHQKDGLSEITNVNIKARLEINDQISDLETRLEELKKQPQSVEVDAEITDVTQEIDLLKLRLVALGESPTDLEIKLAKSEVQEQIDQLTAEREANVKLNSTFDTTAVDQKIEDLQAEKEAKLLISPGMDTSKIDGEIANLTANRDFNLQANSTFDTTEINGKIAELKEAQVNIDGLSMPTNEFEQQANAVVKRVGDINSMTATPKVTLNTLGFYSAVENVNSALDLIPRNVTTTVTTNYVNNSIGPGLPALPSYFDGRSKANGTAHAGGSWGARTAGKSLVGELGQEIMVDPYTGKWRTVGDYGAEFVNVPRGAIIFNHVQTKEILENGYVTGRGTAFLNGTAFIGGGGPPNWKDQPSWGYPAWGGGSGDSGYTPPSYDDSYDGGGYDGDYEEATEDVEEYISTLWQLYEVEKKLQDVQDYKERLENRLDLTENTVEQLKLQKEMLEVYKNEQNALNAVNEERRALIKEKIAELEQQGFQIDYDPQSNDLFIKNMKHVNELVGGTMEETNDLRQEAEDMIETVIDWNDANKENSQSWLELKKAMQETRKEIVDTSMKVFDSFIDYADSFDLWADTGTSKVAVLKARLKEINRLHKEGYLTLEQYKEALLETGVDIYDEQKSALEEIIDLTKQLIKQEIEDQIDALEKQKEEYREIIRLKKESLDQNRKEDKYQDELSEKMAALAKKKAQIDKITLAANSGDRNAIAQKAALEEEYADMQKEMVDYQEDYAYDKRVEGLDNQLDEFEKKKDEEIKTLQEKIDTEVELYNLAIDRINSGWDELYKDILDWNSKYGEGIDGEDSIKSAWDNAREALEKYGDVLKALDGIKTENSTSNVMNDVNALTAKMQANTNKWHAASPEERKRLEQENENYAKQIAEKTGRKVLKSYEGAWYLDEIGGKLLYDQYPGASTSQTAKVTALVARMKSNGQKWLTSKGEEKEKLAADNLDLANQISALLGRKVLRDYAGKWHLDSHDGEELFKVYHDGGVAGDLPKLKDKELFSIIKKGEIIFNEEQKRNLEQMVDMNQQIKSLLPLSNGGQLPLYMPRTVPGAGGMDITNTVTMHIQVNGDADKEKFEQFGKAGADKALSNLSDALKSYGLDTLGRRNLRQ